MTITLADALAATLLGGLAGASAAAALTLVLLAGRAFARRYLVWRAPPPPEPVHISGVVNIECPHCGGPIGAEIGIEGPFPPGEAPPPAKPLGERLLREKAALQARRDALAADDVAKRRDIDIRIEELDRQLGRLN
jgi:hypothetical protein